MISKLSKIFIFLYVFMRFFFYMFRLLTTNSHNPGVFYSLLPHWNFSVIHFPLCMGTECNEEWKSVGIWEICTTTIVIHTAVPESLFHFHIQINIGILYVLSLLCRQNTQQPPSTVFFRANKIDSPLVGSINSLECFCFVWVVWDIASICASTDVKQHQYLQDFW